MKRRTAYPDRKISETFLHFAEPALVDLPDEALEQRFRQVLEVCFTVWNAVVIADVRNDHRHLDQIRRLTAGHPEIARLMEQLIARKRTLFADDERLIGNWELTRTPDGLNLRADACDPRSVPAPPAADLDRDC